MRLKMVLAAIAISGTAPAFAQGWMEYPYPDMDFAVQFPAAPNVESGSYTAHDGMTAPATIYSVQEGKITFKMTVADFSKLANEQANALDDAVKAVAETGDIVVNVNSRISGEYGRELNVVGKDGSHSTMAVFYFGQKLYELEAKVLPPKPQAGSGEAIRFQQSLRFTGAGGRFGRGPGGPGFGGPRFRRNPPGNPPPGNTPNPQ